MNLEFVGEMVEIGRLFSSSCSWDFCMCNDRKTGGRWRNGEGMGQTCFLRVLPPSRVSCEGFIDEEEVLREKKKRLHE